MNNRKSSSTVSLLSAPFLAFSLLLLFLCCPSAVESQYASGEILVQAFDNVQGSTVYSHVHYPSNATHGEQFPLIVFTPGWIQGSSYYNYLWTEWVPTGFVVAMMSTYDYDPASSPLEETYDQLFMLSYLQNISKTDKSSPLYGLLNDKSANMGHSEGGWASIFAGDPKWTNYSYPNYFGATLTLSACWAPWDFYNGEEAIKIQKTPLFLITGTNDCFCHDDWSLVLYNYSASTCKYVADIINGGHCDFGWDGFGNVACKLFGDALGCLIDYIIDPFVQQAIVKSYATPWINFILKGDQSAKQQLANQLQKDKNSVSNSAFSCNGMN